MKHALCMILPAVRQLKTLPSLKAMVLLLFLLVTGIMQGCGGGGGSENNPPPVVPPTGLSYNHPAIAAMMNQAIDGDVPTVTGTVTSYAVSPALPAGLSLDSLTGVISGTPSALAAKASYTVSASNSAGSTTATIQIAVALPPPTSLSYSQIAGTVNVAITPDVPIVTGTVSSYAVSPPLPTGLILDASTGMISGTPTAVSTQASYIVTASNSGGSATAAVQISVTLPAPTDLEYPQTVIGTYVGQAITPDIPGSSGGAITSFTVTPALPPGLSMDPSTGVISGTPNAPAAQATYVVTGSNSAGTITADVSPTITVTATPNVLLQVGNQGGVYALQFANSNVFSQGSHYTVVSQGNSATNIQIDELWTLWNYESGTILASGDAGLGNGSVQGFTQQAQMAGPTLAIGIPGGIQVLSSADGHALGTIVSPGFGVQAGNGLTEADSWQLASDGSYISIETASGLFVFTPGGQLVFSRAGIYNTPVTLPFVQPVQVFAAPGQVQVANGPAGQFTIETITVPNGISTLADGFGGVFLGWSPDGAEFLTSVWSENNTPGTIYVYSNSSVRKASLQFPPYQMGGAFGGVGNWVWSCGPSSMANMQNYVLQFYSIDGTSQWNSIYSCAGFPHSSGTTLAVFSSDGKTFSVIDLSSATPTATNYSLPAPLNNAASSPLNAYAGVSNTQWVAGFGNGSILDGASLLSGSPRYLGIGSALSIAGGTGDTAISTGSGQIYYFNPADATPEGSVNLTSGEVELSSDGSVLAASSQDGSLLNVYSLPSGTVSDTFSYPTGLLSNFTLSGSGTTLGQVESNTLQVTPISGSPTIWSIQDQAQDASLRLSPDGTLIAVTTGLASGGQSAAKVTVYQNGQQIATLTGVGVGWIDNSQLLVNHYTQNSSGAVYAGCSIYSPTGALLATPALPELHSIQPVTSDTVYEPSLNTIYSFTTGEATWTSPYPPDSGNAGAAWIGAVSGPYVVFESEGRVIAVKY